MTLPGRARSRSFAVRASAASVSSSQRSTFLRKALPSSPIARFSGAGAIFSASFCATRIDPWAPPKSAYTLRTICSSVAAATFWVNSR